MNKEKVNKTSIKKTIIKEVAVKDNKNKHMTTGQLLRKLREEKGWSVPHFAKLRHIDDSLMYMYESDKLHPKPERLQHILKSYYLTIEQFVNMLDDD